MLSPSKYERGEGVRNNSCNSPSHPKKPHFRQDLRDFLKAELPPDWKGADEYGRTDDVVFERHMRRKPHREGLADHGLAPRVRWAGCLQREDVNLRRGDDVSRGAIRADAPSWQLSSHYSGYGNGISFSTAETNRSRNALAASLLNIWGFVASGETASLISPYSGISVCQSLSFQRRVTKK